MVTQIGFDIATEETGNADAASGGKIASTSAQPARKSKKRFVRFGLGTFLVLFLIVGGIVGLAANYIGNARRIAKTVENHMSSCSVKFDYQFELAKGEVPTPPGPEFLRRFGGDNLFSDIKSIYVQDYHGESIFRDLKPADLQHVEVLSINNDSFGPDLFRFPEMPSVERIRLSSQQITSLAGIDSFPKLSFLRIRCWNSVIDIDALKTCQNLETIVFGEAEGIRDFSPLYGLPCLTKVTIHGSRLSGAQIKQIQRDLPDGCQFEFVRGQ